MPKLIIATPNRQLYDIAATVLSNAGIKAVVLQATSADVVQKVREQLGSSTGVVVARGNHAHLLKTQLHVPVVDIVLTGQDIAVLLDRACKSVDHPRPRIAFVGFRYMFSNCEPIAKLLGADVSVYYAANSQEIPDVIQRVREADIELVIGGEIACRCAEEQGLKSLFMDSMTESMVNAVRTASHMLEALNIEHQKTAEFMSLLNYSFDIILKLDNSGRILLGNYMAERALHRTSQEMVGLRFFELIHTSNAVEDAIARHQSLYSTVISIGESSFVSNIAPIDVDGRNDGFIVSMQDFGSIDDLEEKVRAERRCQGFVAKAKFSDYQTESRLFQQVLDDAQLYAQYNAPLLISGPAGTRKRELAEAIHNASILSRNPFVMADLSVIPTHLQTRQLFGSEDGRNSVRGLLTQAQKGTLYLRYVEMLDDEGQRQLLNLLKNGQYQREGMPSPIPISVRVICSTNVDLHALSAQGRFLEPLCRLLLQKELRLPALCRRAEDVPRLLSRQMDLFSAKYKKHPSFTSGALEWLIRYPWPGNDLQLEHFCENAVMLAHSNLIDDSFPTRLLGEDEAPADRLIVVSSAEERELRDALDACGGDRFAAAEKLGVSRSTLWRRMKKYNVAQP